MKKRDRSVRLLFLGAPGTGKTTQAQRLANHLGIPWISTGEILRQGIQTQSDLGQQAQPYVERGELVPDRLLIDFIRTRLQEPDVFNGWILDGYPRTSFQAEELDFMLAEVQQRLDFAIWLDVGEEVLLVRSPQSERPDNEPEVLKTRLREFRQATLPLAEYYLMRGHLLTVQTEDSPEAVFQSIVQQLKG